MTTLWKADVTQIGPDAAEMLEAGVLILFGEPVPDALAEVSVVHANATPLVRPIAAGDTLLVSGVTYTLDAVGERANANLTELGHIVIYVNQPEQELLPGAILATGPELSAPVPGSVVEFTGA